MLLDAYGARSGAARAQWLSHVRSKWMPADLGRFGVSKPGEPGGPLHGKRTGGLGHFGAVYGSNVGEASRKKTDDSPVPRDES